MMPVDFIVQSPVEAAISIATDRHFMRAVQRRSRTRSGVLRVYGLPGDVLAIGRYHLAPPAAQAQVHVHRRHCGGRVLPFGDGFVGVSLILPHRSALLAEEPYALAPYQVLNRYVRGILEACRLVQVPASYPGRDFVTANRRLLAGLSFEVDEHGALLFEAIIANTRDFSLLPEYMASADRGGEIKGEMLTPATTTSLARELGTELTVGEVAEMLRRGFAKQFDLHLEPHELSPLEVRAIDAIAARECRPEQWLGQRQRRPDLDRRATVWAQLGAFETYFSLKQDRFIKDILFVGDFIANSPAIEALERELRLCPLEWRAIDAVVSGIYSRPENFILGVGKLRTIADMIMREAVG